VVDVSSFETEICDDWKSAVLFLCDEFIKAENELSLTKLGSYALYLWKQNHRYILLINCVCGTIYFKYTYIVVDYTT